MFGKQNQTHSIVPFLIRIAICILDVRPFVVRMARKICVKGVSFKFDYPVFKNWIVSKWIFLNWIKAINK